ncbi:MAG: hypothetical protein ACQETE_14955 [Bacteroidota bacterium]
MDLAELEGNKFRISVNTLKNYILNYPTTGWVLSIFIALLTTMMIPPQNAQAQLVMGARSLGMAQSAAALNNNAWAVFANPASIEETHTRGSFYGVRYYGFSEITDMAASISHPISEKWGVVSMGFHRYGFDLFQEQHIRLGYAHRWKKLRAGVGLNYAHMRIENYGSAGTVGLDLGLMGEITENLTVGSHITNINRAKLGEAEEELPRILTIGVTYEPGSSVLVTVDAVKDVRYPIAFRGGTEIQLIEQLYIRGGVSTEPVTFSLGLGYIAQRWSINIAAQRHQLLGISPGLDLSVRL